MSYTKSLKAAMTLMVATAILAPTATAQPVDPPRPDVKAETAQSQASADLPLGVLRGRDGVNDSVNTGTFEPSPVPGTNGVDSSGGFDWGDAAIGGAAMLGLLSLGAAVVLFARRSRGRGQPVAAS